MLSYFNNCSTLDECKIKYRELAKKYHPDVSEFKDGNKFREMKTEYDNISKNPNLLNQTRQNTSYSSFYNTTSAKAKAESSRNDFTDFVDDYLRDHLRSEFEKKVNSFKGKYSTISLKDKIDELIQTKEKRGYKNYWIVYQFDNFCNENKRKASLVAFKYIEDKLGYKKGWAEIKYSTLNSN